MNSKPKKSERSRSDLSAEEAVGVFKNPRSASPIDILSDDCLMKIFSYLTISEKLVAEKVCKRWFRISKGGWVDVKFLCLKWQNTNLNQRQVKRVFRRCGRFVKHLSIPVTHENSYYMRLVEYHCPKLEALQITFDYWAFRPVVQDYYKNLSRMFATFEKLNCVAMHDINSDATDEHLSYLPVGTLTKLMMFGTHGESISVPISANMAKFRNLRSLHLFHFVIRAGCLQGLEELENLSDLNFSFSEMHEKDIDRIKSIKNLEELCLEQGPSCIRDCHVSNIARNCGNLRVLKLDGLSELTDACLRDVSRLSKLRELSISQLSRVTDRGIAELSQLQQLNCNHCNGITNCGLKTLIQSSPSLITLSVHGTADMGTFLEDASAAIRARRGGKRLMLYVDQVNRNWPMPENSSSSLLLV